MLLSLLLACSPAPSSVPAVTAAPSAPTEATTTAASAGVRKDADIPTFRAARDAGTVGRLLDVRTPEEFAAGHVPGAVNVPIDALEGRLGELASARGQDLYVICAVGGRSAIAADQLAAAGFSATNVLGGTNAWVAAGGAVER